MAITTSPASERQVSYLTSLLSDRACDAAFRADITERIADGTLDKRTASNAIDTLMRAPRAVAPAVAALTVGMYR